MWASNQTVTLDALMQFDPHYYQGKGVELRFLCPYCGHGKPQDHRHRSFCVNIAQEIYICQRADCHVKGKLGHQSNKSCGISQAMIDKIRAEADAKAELARIEYLKNLRHVKPIENTPGFRYLTENRKLPAAILKNNGIRFSYDWYGSQAVLFPIRDEKQKLIAVNSRYIKERQVQHRTVGNKLKGIFSTNNAFSYPAIFVTEAPIDALSIFTAGYAAMATCGEGLPSWLMKNLQGKHCFIATDNDKAGDKIASRWSQIMMDNNVVALRIRPKTRSDWNNILVHDGEDYLAEQINYQLEELRLTEVRSTTHYAF